MEKAQLSDLSKALGGFIKKDETLKVDTKVCLSFIDFFIEVLEVLS